MVRKQFFCTGWYFVLSGQWFTSNPDHAGRSQMNPEMMPDEPNRSQASRDGHIWAQMVSDVPSWSQMLPDELKWMQVITSDLMIPHNPKSFQIIFQLAHRRCLLPDAFSQFPPPEWHKTLFGISRLGYFLLAHASLSNIFLMLRDGGWEWAWHIIFFHDIILTPPHPSQPTRQSFSIVILPNNILAFKSNREVIWCATRTHNSINFVGCLQTRLHSVMPAPLHSRIIST